MKQRTLGYIHLSNESHVSELTAHRSVLSAADAIYEDVHCGGRIVERTQFRQLLSDANPGDTIICVSLDRWAWTLPDLHASIAQLHAKGVTLNILEPNLVFSPGTDVESSSPIGLKHALARWDTKPQKRKIQHVGGGGTGLLSPS